MKIQEAIDRICAWHEPFVSHKGGRDKVLFGDTDQELTGVVVCICATYRTIQEAAALGANFIISHESIFFGGQLSPEDLQENDAYQAKARLLEETGVVVWRDHDRMHGNGKPFHPVRKRNDYIFWGICQELGWEPYIVDDPMKPLLYKIPATTADELARTLMEAFDLEGLRIVGDASCPVETVWFAEHAMGNKEDGAKVKEAQQADAIIPFEICDYTVTQYVRDAAEMGQGKVILEMGHFNCEALGMKACLRWLPEALGEDVPLTYLHVGDTYHYVTR